MATMTKLIAVSVFIQLALAGRAAAIPPNLPPNADLTKDIPASLALGAGAAGRLGSGGSGRPAFPLELTLTPTPFLFTSGGLVFSGGGVDHGYVEVGVWMLLSVAAGGGFGAYDSAEGRRQGGVFHLFVGAPIPFESDTIGKAKWLPYFEPYYRPSWGPWPGTVHEVGFMLKISYWFKDPIGKIGG